MIKRLFTMRDWSLATKLALLLVALTIAPLSIVTFYNDVMARAELHAAADAQNLRRAQSRAYDIDNYLRERLAHVRFLAVAAETAECLKQPQDAERRAAQTLRLQQARQIFDYDALYLTDASGSVVAATEARLVGRNYVAARWFRNAVAGQISLDEPRYDAEDARVYLHFSAPVQSQQGVILGAVVSRITMAQIDRIIAIDDGIAGFGSFGVLWDDLGIRLSMGLDPTLRFKPFAPLSADVANALIAEARFGPATGDLLNDASQMPEVVARSKLLLYDRATDPHLRVNSGVAEPTYVVIVPLNAKRWLYGFFVPAANIHAALDAQTERARLAALLAALAAVLIAFVATRVSTRPIRRVAETANAIAAGDMTRRVGLRQRDEAGQLAAAFDAMADALAEKDAQLRGYARQLEQRVAERTASLQESEQRYRRRSEELAALNRTSQSLSQLTSPAEMMQLLFTVVGQVLDNRNLYIALYDAASQTIAFPLYTINGEQRAVASRPFQNGLTEYVIRSQAPLLVPRDLPGFLAAQGIDLIGTPARCFLAAPMLRGRKVLGVIAVQDYEREQVYDVGHAELLAALAAQAASALENARLFEELQGSLAMTTRLYQMSARLLTTTTMEETQHLATRTLHDAFAADASDIVLFDAQGNVVSRYGIGLSPTFYQEAQHRPDGLTMQVWRSGKPLIITEPERMHPRVRAEGIQATIVLPLRSETENLGALFISYRRPHVFGDHEVELFTLFANQAALAVKRVRLMEETRQHVVELEAVNQISIALRAAHTLDEIAPLFLDETCRVLGADAATLWLYDESRDELRQVAAHGFPGVNVVLKPGEGITGRVFTTGETYISREFQKDPLTVEAARQQNPPGLGGAAVPIRTAQAIVGVLFVSVRLPRELTAAEVRLLTTLAEMVGNAIHRMALHAQTERRLQQVQTLHTVDMAISASVSLHVILNIFLEQVMAQLKVDAADILLFNAHTQTLEYAAGRGFRSRAREGLRLRLGEGAAGRAALERRTIEIRDWRLEVGGTSNLQFPISDLQAEGFVAYYGIPLIAKGQVQGVLEVFHRARLSPDAEWVYFLEALASQAAIAIDNGRLFDNLQRSNIELALAYDTTIASWSRALELHDWETEGHAARVAELTARLARALGLHDEELLHIRRGALLHDVGKTAIPDTILFKPGPLTDAEWEIVRRHPQVSYDLLAPIAYLRPALDIPYCHHEKWDGSGYPRGLRGAQIPLAARIFAVVDVWDALLSERSYRAAWSRDRALAYIQEQAGRHFDPQVVEAFLRVVNEQNSVTGK